MKITRDQVTERLAKPPLGEEAWITLENDPSERKAELRVDHLTRKQMRQYRRLEQFVYVDDEKWEHPDEYLLRACVKETRNIDVDGEPVKLNFIGGTIAHEPCDLIAVLEATGLFQEALSKARILVLLTESEKKKLSSLLSSSGTDGQSDSPGEALSSPAARR